ncbi:hypothetical protein LAUMK191_05605 [Mycobacterium attenuatum]|uniref:hypothetical protein n=1 Tax=Mycobacterium attenuatum TaxID=2341086 RepID=UPI000F02BA2D|nr:hypothetical protein [Mycobacterium attenuatum]VBA60603.1 hypothetical protein LAUMK191_05605 [Mycobacterium attenuatum]
MSKLPPGYSEGSCHSADGPLADSGAIAMIECSSNWLPNGPTSARYTLFRDTVTLGTLVSSIYHSHHFKPVTCPGMESTPTPWTRPDGTPAGSIARGKAEGDIAALIWSNNPGPLIALVEGGSGLNNLPAPDVGGLWQWHSRGSSSALPG